MKIKFIVITTLFFFFSTYSQDNNQNKNSLVIIDEVPVYPGCEGNNEELKICFSKSIQEFFVKKFDADLPNKLNLKSGAVKVFMFFKINKMGDVDSIIVKAPHPALVSSIKDVMSQLPKMTPGKVKGENVNVKYSIPFTIIIEETRAQRRARRKMEKEQ